MISWKSGILVAILSVFLLGCAPKVSQENYNKITSEMSYEAVKKILGKPTKTTRVGLGEVSATTATWEGKQGNIIIQFFNNKVKLKNFSAEGVEHLEVQ